MDTKRNRLSLELRLANLSRKLLEPVREPSRSFTLQRIGALRSPSQSFAALSDDRPQNQRDICDLVTREVASLFGFQGAALFLAEGEGSPLCLSAHIGMQGELVQILNQNAEHLDIKAGAPETGTIKEQKRTPFRTALNLFGYHTQTVVPLQTITELQGLLLLVDPSPPPLLIQDPNRFAQLLGIAQHQINIALEHQKLHWKNRRNMRRIEAVGRILGKLLRIERTSTLLDSLCAQLHRTFSCTSVWIGMFQGAMTAPSQIAPQYISYERDDLKHALASTLHHESIYLSALKQKKLACHKTSAAQILREDHYQAAIHDPSHSLHNLVVPDGLQETLLVPLILRECVAGLLVLHRDHPFMLAKEDTILLNIFADQVALAIRSERLLKQVERRATQLGASEDLYKSFVQQISDGIFRLSPLGTIVEVSDVALEIMGARRDDALGKPLVDKVVESDQKRAREAIQNALQGQSQKIVLHLAQNDRQPRVAVVHMGPLIQNRRIIGVIGVARDDTRRRAIQNRLLMREKMASVGMMASGVAHEINNPLSVVNSNLLLLSEDLDRIHNGQESLYDHQEHQEMIEESRESATRIRSIVAKLRKYTYQSTDVERHDADLLDMIDSAIWMSHTELRHQVEIHAEVPADLPTLYCNSGQLVQVVVQLLFLAIQHATVAGDDFGEVFIKAQHKTPFIELEVRDSGEGLSPDKLRLIMEPSYTDNNKRSSGIGLSMCREVIRNHKGQLQINTIPGKGTEMRVILPAAPSAEADKPDLILRYNGTALDGSS